MTATARDPAMLVRLEPWLVWVLAALALAAFPLLQGHIGIIWDALNHHFYLGWIAERPRFDRDLLAAGSQAYQYPYLYWPAYKLALAGASGATAGAVLGLLQSLAAPALWLIARRLCPGERWEDVAFRLLGVALAFAGGVTLSLTDTTSNDVLTGIPLLWAIALGLMSGEPEREAGRRTIILVMLSGFLAGVSVAFKLSNGPLVVVMPLLWALAAGGLKAGATRLVLGCTAVLLGFAAAYAPWGWQMWQQFGNPIYPFYDVRFDLLRDLLDWRRP